MITLIELINLGLSIYVWIIIAGVVISWLVAFDVMNTKNPMVYKICTLINQVTEPVMGRVRRVIPPLGGIDISPIVVILGISIIQNILWDLVY